jgi:hypothetical protein
MFNLPIKKIKNNNKMRSIKCCKYCNENEDMETIKECPFCGENTRLEDHYIVIKCSTCGASGPRMNGGDIGNADFVDHNNAIKAWNRPQRQKKLNNKK